MFWVLNWDAWALHVPIFICTLPSGNMTDFVSVLFTLVGHPIHVTKYDKPPLEEVMRVQMMYIEELTRSVVFPPSSPVIRFLLCFYNSKFLRLALCLQDMAYVQR